MWQSTVLNCDLWWWSVLCALTGLHLWWPNESGRWENPLSSHGRNCSVEASKNMFRFDITWNAKLNQLVNACVNVVNTIAESDYYIHFLQLCILWWCSRIWHYFCVELCPLLPYSVQIVTVSCICFFWVSGLWTAQPTVPCLWNDLPSSVFTAPSLPCLSIAYFHQFNQSCNVDCDNLQV